MSTPADATSPRREAMLADLRTTGRALMGRPGFALLVVSTLALGLGASTAVFSVANAVLLRPLPFADVDRVVVLGEVSRSSEAQLVAPVTFDDWRTRQRPFAELAAFRYWETVNLEDATGEPEPITLTTGTENLFRALGIAPRLGRTYREEQNPVGGSEAVISHELWLRRYRGAPDVLGRDVRIRGALATIVGVMPPMPTSLATGWGDVWTCLYRYNIAQQRVTGYRSRYLTVVGRLSPGVSFEQARSEMDALQRQLWTEPTSVADGFNVRLAPLRDTLLGGARLPLLVVTGGVLVLLAVTCANVTTLMLIRTSSRRRETATRLALGARPSRVVRLLVLEGLVLALMGGALGLIVAWAGLRALASIGTSLPRFAEATLTLDVVGFAMVLSILTALACSVAPLTELRRTNLWTVLSESGRSGTASPRAQRLRRLLVAIQVAMACLLLVVGGLLLRSYANVLQVDPGFDASRAVYLDLYVPAYPIPTRADWISTERTAKQDIYRFLVHNPQMAEQDATLLKEFTAQRPEFNWTADQERERRGWPTDLKFRETFFRDGRGPRITAARAEEYDRRVRVVDDRVRQQRARQQALVRVSAVLSPAIAFYELSHELAGTSGGRYEAFLNQRDTYIARLHAFHWAPAFTDAVFTPTQFDLMPRFQYVEEPDEAASRRVVLLMASLAAVTLAAVAIAVHLVRRQDCCALP